MEGKGYSKQVTFLLPRIKKVFPIRIRKRIKIYIVEWEFEREKPMKLIDYTGKLNNHNEYLQAIRQLENKCIYIEYVLVNENEREFIEKFESLIVSVEAKNKWWGTKSSRKNRVYKVKSSKEIFNYLKRFETFCKYTVSDRGNIVKDTDFGINDIAFLTVKSCHYYLRLHMKVIL